MHKRLWIALGLATVAAVLTYVYISQQEAALRLAGTPIHVLVAKKSVARGSTLTADKVTIQAVPGAYLMPGAISSSDPDSVIKQWQEYKGQYALVPISKGEQILPNKLSRLVPGFAAAVPEGMRIVTLAMDPAGALGGHVRPGNRVDVLGSFDCTIKGIKRMTSVALVQNLLVTGVGDDTVDALDKEKMTGTVGGTVFLVSVAVTPEDALRLTLAEREGMLKLSLRSLGDEDLLALSDQSLGSVLGPLLRSTGGGEDRRSTHAVEIIKGTE